MNKWLWAAGGVALGVALGVTVFRSSETKCCQTLGKLVRGEVGEKFGGFAVGIGDTLNLWDVSPEIVALTEAFGGGK